MNLTFYAMKTLHKSFYFQDKKEEKTVRADVVFGSPTKRCVGIGICQVNPYRSNAVNRNLPCCQQVETTLQLIHPDRLEFSFSRKKICKKMIGRQFAYSKFRITDGLRLPEWLEASLEIGKAHLVPGTYPVLFGEESIRVSIKIKRS
jgi:hypothetical protein